MLRLQMGESSPWKHMVSLWNRAGPSFNIQCDMSWHTSDYYILCSSTSTASAELQLVWHLHGHVLTCLLMLSQQKYLGTMWCLSPYVIHIHTATDSNWPKKQSHYQVWLDFPTFGRGTCPAWVWIIAIACVTYSMSFLGIWEKRKSPQLAFRYRIWQQGKHKRLQSRTPVTQRYNPASAHAVSWQHRIWNFITNLKKTSSQPSSSYRWWMGFCLLDLSWYFPVSVSCQWRDINTQINVLLRFFLYRPLSKVLFDTCHRLSQAQQPKGGQRLHLCQCEAFIKKETLQTLSEHTNKVNACGCKSTLRIQNVAPEQVKPGTDTNRR